jgi:hypothetical protein
MTSTFVRKLLAWLAGHALKLLRPTATKVLVALALFGALGTGVCVYILHRERVQAAAYREWVRTHPLVVEIPVPQYDTVVVHDTLPTHTDSSGTRTAEFHDSTYVGTLDGLVTAPPTGPLGIQYQLTAPAFNPTFTLTTDSAFVDWRGRRYGVAYTPPTPPVTPPSVVVLPSSLSLLGWQVGAQTSPSFRQWRAQAGLVLRPSADWSVVAELEQRVQVAPWRTDRTLWIGVTHQR